MAHGQLYSVALGGGEKARQLHLSRNKMLPRDRVNNVLDPGFVLKSLVCKNSYWTADKRKFHL